MIRKTVFAFCALAATAACSAAPGRAYIFPWVELIGFDNTLPDYGVGAYLEKMPRNPDAISLLLNSSDTFRNYPGAAAGDYTFPPTACSYRSRPYNSERRRQAWKASQLKGLVAELRRNGIEVYTSFFLFRTGEFVEDDVPGLAEKLVEFLSDFGFTGYHGADGFAPPIHVLETRKLGSPLNGPEDPARPRVARKEAKRYADAWRLTVGKLKGKGLKCFINTCWTLDPYEALYRYGVDYRLLAETGIDGFIVESSASAKLLLHEQPATAAARLDRSIAMLMRLKAACPKVPLILLHTIHDGTEQWSAIRHAPCAMRAEGISMGGVFFGNRHALDGYLPCLSDALTKDEWTGLFKVWDLGLAPATAPFGLRYVWSDRAFDAEFDACAASLDCSSSTFLAEMLHHGAMVNSAVRVEDALADPSIPLLIVNPKFFPPDELAALRRRQVRVYLVGQGSGAPDFQKFELKPPEKRVFPFNRFWDPLPENMPPIEVIQRAAGNASPPTLVSETPGVRLCGYHLANGRFALLARNENDTYANAKIRVGMEVADILTHTDFPSSPIKTTIAFRIAPHDTSFLSLGEHESPLPGQPISVPGKETGK